MTETWLEKADCLVSLEEINKAVDEIAAQLNSRFENQEILALCVLNGGIVFTGQLLPRLTMSLKLDYIHASRYREALSGGDVISYIAQPSVSLEGKHVLVLDDIFDEGRTLEGIVAHAKEQRVASVTSAVL